MRPGATARMLAVSAWMLVCSPLPAETTVPATRITSTEKPECWVDLREVPAAAYPKQARREEQQGSVVVEFTARDKWGAPKAPEVATSSGFPLLDDEALKAVRKGKARTNCPGVLFSYKIKFKINYD